MTAKNKNSRFAVFKVFKSFGTRQLLWAVIFFVITTLILGSNYIPNKLDLKAGEVSNQEVKAGQSVTYVSEILMEKARQQAADSIDPIFEMNMSALEESNDEISGYFTQIKQLKENEELAENEKIQELQNELGFDLSWRTRQEIINASLDEINNYEQSIKEVIRNEMEKGVQKDAVEDVREDILQNVQQLDINPEIKPLLYEIIRKVELKPTLVQDVEGTQARKQEVVENIDPVRVTIQKGERVVDDGEVITEEDIEALQHLGLLHNSYQVIHIFGLALLVFVLYILIILYLYRYNTEVIRDYGKFILLGLLINVGLLLNRGIVSINFVGGPEFSSLIGFMVPTAAVSILIAILLDKKLALFLTLIMSIFAGILMDNQLHFTSVSLIGGIVGVYSVSDINERTDITRASIYIIIANITAICAVTLIKASSAGMLAGLVSLGAIVGLINGILSVVLAIGALPFLENTFGITTSVKLLELSNPSQPLLKRLMLEAPGTYHHSAMVANLAEGAADATGADPLLTKVGAYYHDIGKLKRPGFFIENQFSPDNPHEKLSPNLSTLVVTSHVKDGIELAKENKLPKPIIDIIHQHHGSTLVSYFYNKALNSEYAETVQEIDFRYDGPKPRTKEAAIIMLADSVEAAVRALKFTGHGRLEATIRKVAWDRLEDGQLEKSELTFKELEDIIQAFVRVLNGTFHTRIEYPDKIIKEMGGDSENNGNNSEKYPTED